MIIPQSEKHLHPQYREYTELYEKTLTNLEAGARGSGAPEAVIAACLKTARLFYDADSAALVEANLELGYGVCVAENCREGIRSFDGRIIDVTPENTPFLYDKIMRHEVFEVNASEISANLPPEISRNEVEIFKRLNVEILVVAPYCKRNTGYLYILNPRRYVGLYGMIQALSYVCASERNEFKLMDDLNISVSTKKCKTDRDVYVKVFGGLSITTKFGTLTESEINSPLAIRLVAYLMLHDTQKVSQHDLADALWPNSEVDGLNQVKNIVHRTKNILRPIFPDNLIASDKIGNYYINPSITLMSDASVFESFFRNGMLPSATRKERIANLRSAVQIYSNDFLPNYVDDHWLNNQRTYYRVSYVRAVKELLPLLYEQQAYSEMFSVTSTALSYEPEQEAFHFWHVRVMDKLGSYDLAQKHFSQHIQLFNDDQKKLLTSILQK